MKRIILANVLKKKKEKKPKRCWFGSVLEGKKSGNCFKKPKEKQLEIIETDVMNWMENNEDGSL